MTNKNEKRIVKEFHIRILEHIMRAPPSLISSTFAPFYDNILDESKKNCLTQI